MIRLIDQIKKKESLLCFALPLKFGNASQRNAIACLGENPKKGRGGRKLVFDAEKHDDFYVFFVFFFFKKKKKKEKKLLHSKGRPAETGRYSDIARYLGKVGRCSRNMDG